VIKRNIVTFVHNAHHSYHTVIDNVDVRHAVLDVLTLKLKLA